MNNDYQNYFPQTDSATLTNRLSAIMRRVYVKMTLALLVTAFVAYFCSQSMEVIKFFANNPFMMWILLGVELLIVIGVSGGINRLSSSAATGLFYLFAVVNGLMLFPIVLAYTGESIAKTFFITAGVFGGMSVYGYFTSRDLTRMGSLLIMALIGLIICSVVNIFLHSDTMGWIISIAGVLIFIGLTAWDTQQIKRMALQAPDEAVSKLATIGALTLYLDFINLFLYLLRFFGQRD
ncbi:MAG: Bax inhibitor-1/YccA family protein [Paramuribaculum sp.]|nr:Bax inhibitor-1/YccA family protein [Paramuribaculum sp.]